MACEGLIETKLQVEVDIVEASYRVAPEALFLKIARGPIGGDGDVPKRDEDEHADHGGPAQHGPIELASEGSAARWAGCIARSLGSEFGFCGLTVQRMPPFRTECRAPVTPQVRLS